MQANVYELRRFSVLVISPLKTRCPSETVQDTPNSFLCQDGGATSLRAVSCTQSRYCIIAARVCCVDLAADAGTCTVGSPNSFDANAIANGGQSPWCDGDAGP